MGRKLYDSEKDVIKRKDRDANRDPITGTAGAHPVGVGVGAAGGAAAGAAAGTLAGPAGTLLGAAVGAVAGAMVGKAAAEAFDPTVEDVYWRLHYAKEPYYKPGRSYKDYAAGYRAGYEGRTRPREGTLEEVGRDLKAEYNRRRVHNGPLWEERRAPARAAWNRVEHIIPSEAGHGHEKS